jgi:hypothetical protein
MSSEYIYISFRSCKAIFETPLLRKSASFKNDTESQELEVIQSNVYYLARYEAV